MKTATEVPLAQCNGSVNAKGTLLELCVPEQRLLEWSCAVCGGAFGAKKRAFAVLGEASGKLVCLERDAAMQAKRAVHAVHSYCGPCACDSAGDAAAVKMQERPRIGFDVGGVIVPAAAGGDEDTLLGESFKNLLPSAGCVELLAALVQRHGQDAVAIVSKAGDRVKTNTLAWMKHVGFLAATGMAAASVHFVTERSHKAPLCARLGVNVFVDDHLSVLASFGGDTLLVYFKPAAQCERSNILFYDPHVVHVESFAQLATIFQ